MSAMKTASMLIEADIDRMVDSAEDPGTMLEGLIDEMNRTITDLRRETLEVMDLERQLEARTAAAESVANELETRALAAVESDDKQLARRILGERVDALKHWASVSEQLRQACKRTSQLKEALVRMENQMDQASRRRSVCSESSGALLRELRPVSVRRRDSMNLRSFVESAEVDLASNP